MNLFDESLIYGHGVESICFQFCDVCSTNAMRLNAVDVDYEILRRVLSLNLTRRYSETYFIIEFVVWNGTCHSDWWKRSVSGSRRFTWREEVKSRGITDYARTARRQQYTTTAQQYNSAAQYYHYTRNQWMKDLRFHVLSTEDLPPKAIPTRFAKFSLQSTHPSSSPPTSPLVSYLSLLSSLLGPRKPQSRVESNFIISRKIIQGEQIGQRRQSWDLTSKIKSEEGWGFRESKTKKGVEVEGRGNFFCLIVVYMIKYRGGKETIKRKRKMWNNSKRERKRLQ